MRAARLTIRARLTITYTALFAAGGGVLIAITYLLVARSLPVSATVQTAKVPNGFTATCNEAFKNPTPDPNLIMKCKTTFQAGVKAGAQTQRDTTLSHLLLYALLTLAAVTALAALSGWLAAGRVLRRIQRITDAARAASQANLTQRVPLDGPRDEIYELADTFNTMLARLDTSFAGQRRFIANASHELRTPLTVMGTTIDVVLAKTTPTVPEFEAMAQDVRAAVTHATALVESLLTLARTEHALTVREPLDLATVAEDVLDVTSADGIDVHADLEAAPVTGDSLLLERLIANLLDNAIRYNYPGGTVTVATTADRDRHHVQLTITNTGAVVPTDAVVDLLAPFRRLNDRTGPAGFGLGLPIAAAITAAHEGTLSAKAPPTGGLIITVQLPSTADAAEADTDQSTVTSFPSRAPAVLA